MNNPHAMPTPITSVDDWRLQAACRNHDPDTWFPNRTDDARTAQAKQICHTCPVLLQCRAWALNTAEEYGICGGLTPCERHQVIAYRKPA